jgi:hypothetical protein
MGLRMSEKSDLEWAIQDVGGALNAIIPTDWIAPRAHSLAARNNRRIRFFPQRRILAAVDLNSHGSNPSKAARDLLEFALTEISAPARRDCKQAVVALRRSGGVYAAAFGFRSAATPIEIASTARPRHQWNVPMPDPRQTPEQALDDALRLLDVTSAQKPPAAARSAVIGALKLCDVCFRLAGGVLPATAEGFPSNNRRRPTQHANRSLLREAGFPARRSSFAMQCQRMSMRPRR